VILTFWASWTKVLLSVGPFLLFSLILTFFFFFDKKNLILTFTTSFIYVLFSFVAIDNNKSIFFYIWKFKWMLI
jgi:hypothetical protein